MIQYVLECIAFQLAFLLIYDLFLKRETFFQWNRVYLLGTYVLSLVLPTIRIEAFTTQVPQTFKGYPEYLWSLGETVFTVTPQESITTWAWEYILWGLGMILAALLFGYKLYGIYRLRQQGQIRYFKEFTRIVLPNSTVVFSFFRSIFLGDTILKEEHQSIIRHELVHIRQRHSYDLLFFELMRVVTWFNPLVYLYQNRVSELHEFIADDNTVKTHKKEHYQQLLAQVFQTQRISFINQFFKKSLIKKRIVMLQKSKSGKWWKLKYLALVPVVMGILFYTSCEDETISEVNQVDKGEVILVEDVANLTENEEQLVFPHLMKLSFSEEDWKLTIRDKNNSVYFSKPEREDSFISGPMGIPIKAQMRIESSILDEDLRFFKRKIKALEGMVPFVEVDEVPVFPGCEDDSDPRACFNKMMQKHISTHFRYPQEAQRQGVEGRVSVLLTIGEEGNITNIRKRGPHFLLEDEAVRIMEKLPKMTPGKSKGKYVAVAYSIPIAFRLEQGGFNPVSQDADDVRLQQEQLNNMPEGVQFAYDNAVSFMYAEKVPIFPGCEEEVDPRTCFLKKVQQHISKNFKYPKKAQEMGIQGRVNVLFLIDANGHIKNIAKRGPDKTLEDEAERIIALLPRMQPGNHNGKEVAVAFHTPIAFVLN
ncbi:MAG: M56 family metallopeptidase [Bacteroidota bacterium]